MGNFAQKGFLPAMLGKEEGHEKDSYPSKL